MGRERSWNRIRLIRSVKFSWFDTTFRSSFRLWKRINVAFEANDESTKILLWSCWNWNRFAYFIRKSSMNLSPSFWFHRFVPFLPFKSRNFTSSNNVNKSWPEDRWMEAGEIRKKWKALTSKLGTSLSRFNHFLCVSDPWSDCFRRLTRIDASS